MKSVSIPVVLQHGIHRFQMRVNKRDIRRKKAQMSKVNNGSDVNKI